MMVEMFEFLLFVIALNWFIRDVDPSIIKKIVKYGAIILVVILAIASGSLICMIALSIAVGVVGLNYFQKHSSIYR